MQSQARDAPRVGLGDLVPPPAGMRNRFAWLRDMAEEVWQLLGVLTTSPHDGDTLMALDRIHDDYDERYADAVALTFDHTRAETTLAARDAREAQRANMQQLRRDLADARQRLRDLEARPSGPSGLSGTARRVVRRLRRR